MLKIRYSVKQTVFSTRGLHLRRSMVGIERSGVYISETNTDGSLEGDEHPDHHRVADKGEGEITAGVKSHSDCST